MSVIPGDVDTDRQPPMTVPLRHFVVGLALLVAGALVGVLQPLGLLSGLVLPGHVHLLLVGWVAVTIMGAMTQFVPVWSGVSLYSRRLATLELWLVVGGLLGFVASLLLGVLLAAHVFATVMLVGFWTFVYNVGRTLAAARPLDVTERHFALALGYFLVVTTFGLILATGYTYPAAAWVGADWVSLRLSHATLAVFGAVLTTVIGALYQLGTMFTQTELHGVDHYLAPVEEVGYTAGVLALATGRLYDLALLARVGGVLVALGVFAFGIVLARRLYESRVERTPMLTRYAVVAVAMLVWAPLAARTWLADPLAPSSLFGGPALTHLLVFGVVGFVVLGTLYHVVPFIVWVHRYSDRLGYEKVPMIDDLYDSRVAAADFGAVLSGAAAVTLAEAEVAGETVMVAGGAVATLGFGLFALNMVRVVREHGPHTLAEVVVSRRPSRTDGGTAPSPGDDDGARPADE